LNLQKELVDYLGIKQLYAVAGGSMGGMQVLQWTVSYPKKEMSHRPVQECMVKKFKIQVIG
jgi:homoserine acetyltransferase